MASSEKWECPVCHREVFGPDEHCSGAFTERDHPSGVAPVPANQGDHDGEGER